MNHQALTEPALVVRSVLPVFSEDSGVRGHMRVHRHFSMPKECDVIDEVLTDMLFEEQKQMPTSGEAHPLSFSFLVCGGIVTSPVEL